MKKIFFVFAGLLLLTTIGAFAQAPIDPAILEQTTEMMEKSLEVMEKTEDIVDKTSEVAGQAQQIAGQAEQISENVGGGCLIATAAFGSELAPQVQFLRELRDNTVMSTASGASFMTGFNALYYSFSPAIADLERESPVFKEVVKLTITPLISSLSLLSIADIDSDAEMLGYGIGVILLNIGMYFVAPAVLIYSLRKKIGFI